MDPECIKLPGFGLPLNHYVACFRCAFVDWNGKPLTERELNMIDLMNQITDFPSWDRKVFDETVTEIWRQQFFDFEDPEVTEAMSDWVSQVLLINPLLPPHNEKHNGRCV